MPRALLALVLAVMTAGPASARNEAAADAPTADDAAILEQCLSRAAERAQDDQDGIAADTGACIGAAARACMETDEGATTVGMTQCHQRETAWWDDRLNAHYAELEAMLDARAFDRLATAQRAWIDYRDADCAFAYQFWGDGTIRTVVHAQCMLDQTARRTLALEGFLGWQ